MKKHVGVITDDKVLYNKIRLLLRDVANVTLARADEGMGGYDLLLTDTVTENPDAVLIGEGGALPRLFKHEELFALLDRSGEADICLSLIPATHGAYVFGEAVKLTEVEYKLLEVILASDGFVSKEELLERVWGEGYDLGVVNVYVHYLRRKLERDGKRVIVSSRNEGYKIDERYRRKS